MRIEQLIDKELPAPHGNRQGLSYGQLAILLLSYIITQADHRLCAVESWVNQHHLSASSTLSSITELLSQGN